LEIDFSVVELDDPDALQLEVVRPGRLTGLKL
jgi:hypothetical protein